MHTPMYTTLRRFALLAMLVPLAIACTVVDETEHCVVTYYGKVVEQKAASGPNVAMLDDFTCLPLTQQSYPRGDGGEDAPAEKVPAVSRDSVAITLELAADWRYGDPFAAFNDKRSHDRVLQMISNSIRSGTRDAIATIAMSDLFGAARAGLDEKLREAIQKQLQGYVTLERVYIRNVDMPKGIQTAWAEAATARAGQQRARDQFVSDSLNIRRTLMAAEAEARQSELANRATNTIPLEVRVAAEYAKGLANVCAKATTCILGGSVMDSWDRGARTPR